MFLIDKYIIKYSHNIFFHKDIYEKNIIGFDMKKKYGCSDDISISDYDDINKFLINKKNTYQHYSELPNLFVHGVNGVGKHTLVNMLLYDIYNYDIISNVSKEIYQIKGYGNSIIDVEIEQSQYHLIINPSNSGFDKYLIQEIVKEYAKKNLINIFNNNYPYKIIIINNIDNLSYYAQTALRCTMEKYYKTCRFILIGAQVSKLIDPIRSRCLCLRIPTPSIDESKKFLYYLCLKEKKQISINRINKIAQKANGNIKKLIWFFDMAILGIKNYDFFWQSAVTNILQIIDRIINNKKIANNDILQLRCILYKIFITNINGVDILKEIIKQLIYSKKYDDILVYEIIFNSSLYEGRINKGKRTIIHLENFIIFIIQSIWHHKNNIEKKTFISFNNICSI